MVLQETEAVVQTALSDTILATCRKTLPYHDEFSIEGMLHIVLDKKEVVLVNIKETVFKQETRENAEAANSEEVLGESSPSRPVTRRGRKPKKRQIESDNEVESKESSRLMSPVRKSPRTPRPKPSVQYVDSDDNVEVTSDSVEESDEELKPEKDRTITDEPLMQSQTAECETALVKLEKCQSGSSESAAVVGPSGNQDTNNPQDEAVLSATDSKTETDDQYEPASSDPDDDKPDRRRSWTAVTGAVLSRAGERERYKKKWLKKGLRKLYSCEQCGKKCKDSQHLQYHMFTHTGEKPYSCSHTGCGAKFRQKGHLKSHELRHTGVKPYHCKFDNCGKRFYRQDDVKRHERCHTGEKPFSCRICGKIFSQEGDMRGHERRHTGEKPYQCSMCGQRFTDRRNLNRHEKNHLISVTGEKPYLCRTCSKGFVRKADMQTHERIHTGEKPYQCSICGRTFNQKSNMHGHEKIHMLRPKDEVIWQYKCGWCDKRYTEERSLKRHERVHTGQVIKCEYCDASFVGPSYLRRHRENVHKGILGDSSILPPAQPYSYTIEPFSTDTNPNEILIEPTE